MTKTSSRKMEVANRFAKTLGFTEGLSDKKEIGKDELIDALASARALHPERKQHQQSLPEAGARQKAHRVEHGQHILLD